MASIAPLAAPIPPCGECGRYHGGECLANKICSNCQRKGHTHLRPRPCKRPFVYPNSDIYKTKVERKAIKIAEKALDEAKAKANADWIRRFNLWQMHEAQREEKRAAKADAAEFIVGSSGFPIRSVSLFSYVQPKKR